MAPEGDAPGTAKRHRDLGFDYSKPLGGLKSQDMRSRKTLLVANGYLRDGWESHNDGRVHTESVRSKRSLKIQKGGKKGRRMHLMML